MNPDPRPRLRRVPPAATGKTLGGTKVAMARRIFFSFHYQDLAEFRTNCEPQLRGRVWIEVNPLSERLLGQRAQEFFVRMEDLV